MPDRLRRDELLSKIKGFVAEDAVGVTALRGQVSGTRKAVLAFLNVIVLSQIPNSDGATFEHWLDDQTERLRQTLPDPKKPWGVARKALNLFLRSCVYNHYLREANDLDVLEPLLEVPLDSVVGKGLRNESGGALPPWGTLKTLKSEVSRLFQEHATRLAIERGLPARVFLDNYLWLDGRSK